MDPSVIKYKGIFYVIISKLGGKLHIEPKAEYDFLTKNALNLISNTDELLKSIKEL